MDASPYTTSATTLNPLKPVPTGPPGNAAIHINSNFDGVFDPQVEAKAIISNDAFSTLHELVHHAGSKGHYDDIQGA